MGINHKNCSILMLYAIFFYRIGVKSDEKTGEMNILATDAVHDKKRLELSRSRESSELIAKIYGSKAFKRVKTLSNANKIASCIDSGEVILIVSIPPNLAQSLLKEKLTTIQIITDERNTMTASLASNYI